MKGTGKSMIQRIYSILVDNTSGALNRIAGLFSRRGYNIDSLTVGVTADPKYSRMTIVTTSDDELELDQIGRQLAKLVDVRDIKVLKSGQSVNRQLILVKVKTDKEQRRDLIELANIFRAKIVDVGTNSTIVELTGTENKLNAFLRLLDDYEILELARTGITGLSRGMDDVRYL